MKFNAKLRLKNFHHFYVPNLSEVILINKFWYNYHTFFRKRFFNHFPSRCKSIWTNIGPTIKKTALVYFKGKIITRVLSTKMSDSDNFERVAIKRTENENKEMPKSSRIRTLISQINVCRVGLPASREKGITSFSISFGRGWTLIIAGSNRSHYSLCPEARVHYTESQ